MGDDNKDMALANSLAAAEKGQWELMAALVKKFDVLTVLEDWLGRIESTQKQMVRASPAEPLLSPLLKK